MKDFIAFLAVGRASHGLALHDILVAKMHQKVKLWIFFYLIVNISTDELISKHNEIPGNEECHIHDTSVNEIGEIDENLNDLDQEDPALIDFLRQKIDPPAPRDIKYNNPGEINPGEQLGQYGQVRNLAKLFKRKRNGFFIEAGAADGIAFSNTFYFEATLGWTGLLVEPNPDDFAKLRQLKRKSFAFGHCLSTKTTPETVLFDASGLLGGIINCGKKPTKGNEFAFMNGLREFQVNQRTIKIQCFPLFSILQAIGNPTVDLLSLDIEGAEIQVLRTLPWDKVNIQAILVEVDHIGEIFDGSRKDLEDLLTPQGYKHVEDIGGDALYAKDHLIAKT